MPLEKYLLMGSWVLLALLLYFFVPREQLRRAQVIFLFQQFITWFLGLVVVQFQWVVYPIRFFAEASKNSFTFEFIAYPAMTTLFILHFPEKKKWTWRWLYYGCFVSFLTLGEFVLEKYTRLIQYVSWEWYYTWISVLLTQLLCRLYIRWFFNQKEKNPLC